MAKKSGTARRAGAPHRPAGTAKEQRVTLVRAPASTTSPASRGTEAASTIATTATNTATGAAASNPTTQTPPAKQQPATRTSTATKARAVEKRAPAAVPAQAPAAPVQRATPPQTARRAPAPRSPQRQQRARSTNLMVTPEHYSYVKKDLMTIAILAGCMFLVIVICYIVLHAQGQA